MIIMIIMMIIIIIIVAGYISPNLLRAGGVPHQFVDKLEAGQLYPPLDLGVDAKAVFDAVKATDVCDAVGLVLFCISPACAIGWRKALFDCYIGSIPGTC